MSFYHAVFKPLPLPSSLYALLLLQVVSLQSKWIGDILQKTFGCPAKAWDASQAGLAQLLPSDTVVEDAVLQKSLVPVVKLIQDLINYVELKERLECINTVLSPTSLTKVCRPLVKLASTTNFKKLRGHCHQVLAAKCLDEEADAKAHEVKEAVEGLKESLGSAGDDPEVSLLQIVSLVKEFTKVQMETSSLPTAEDSRHKPLKDEIATFMSEAANQLDSVFSETLRPVTDIEHHVSLIRLISTICSMIFITSIIYRQAAQQSSSAIGIQFFIQDIPRYDSTEDDASQ